MLGEVAVKCLVAKGAFESEFIAMIKEGKDVLWEGAIDKELIEIRSAIKKDDQYVSAHVLAFIIEDYGDNVLIELPTEGWSKGSRIRVHKSMLKPAKHPA